MSSALSHALTPADEYGRISVSPIAGALGAEISGVDISRPIDDATFAEIRRAWHESGRYRMNAAERNKRGNA